MDGCLYLTMGETMNKAKKIFDKIPFFIIMFVFGAILILIYSAVTGNTFQRYTDVVNEFTAIHSSNKSAERNLFYVFSIIGAIVYFVYYLVENKYKYKVDPIENNKDEKYKIIILVLFVIASTFYFVYKGTNVLIFASLLVGLISLLKDKEYVIPSITVLFLGSYAVAGAYRLYVALGGGKSLNIDTIVLIVATLTILLVFIEKKQRDVLGKVIIISQILLPFTLLVCIASDYMYKGELKKIYIPYSAKIFIYVLIVVLVIEAIFSLKCNWRKVRKDLNGIITYGTLISIMSFNRFSGSGAIIPVDLHHPFENIIGFSQIFELKQKLFVEYIPVSGMYSVVQGFFLNIFGDDKFSNYYLTENIFYIVVILIIAVLLKRQLSAEISLLTSLLVFVIDYNRIAFIIPIMLLLSDPKLMKNKNLWLKTWYITSFIHGLYYPVFGAAVCFGFLPLGIWQIITYFKTGELKKDIRKASFWIWWVLCSVPVVLGIPLLVGTAKNMRAMSGQTIYADGLTRFGQVVPNDFFSYLPNLSTRLVVYYLFSYMILVSITWASVAMSLSIGKVHIRDKRIKVDNPIGGLISISFGLAILVSMSYTVVRMDVGQIYARSIGIVIPSAVMMLLIVNHYVSEIRLKKYIIVYATFIISAASLQGFFLIDSSIKLAPYYTVSNEYVFVENDRVEKLGTCFVENSVYETIENTYDLMLKKDNKESYLGIAGDFGLYYLCNIKGYGLMETRTIRGFEITKETVDLIRKQKPIVGASLSSIDNYYLYHWLLTSGEYIWSEESRCFEPNEYNVSIENILENNKSIDLSFDGASLGKTASSWGSSMDSLSSCFEKCSPQYSVSIDNNLCTINFNTQFDGENADFVYIEFNNKNEDYEYTLFDFVNSYVQDTDRLGFIKYLTKKEYNRGEIVTVSWDAEDGNIYSINCAMNNGKLLIPLGSGRRWLLNNHSILNIVIQNEAGQTIEWPGIDDIKFLKLREVE